MSRYAATTHWRSESLAPEVGAQRGAVTLTMKTSSSTMNTGANSTGSSQGLRRAGLGMVLGVVHL